MKTLFAVWACIHKLITIAAFEMRSLLRSWIFRIFATVAITGLGVFNIAMNVVSLGTPMFYTAFASSVPYTNLKVLNLDQAIVAILLGSEFLKYDMKNDTAEVFYTRSMTNGQYIAGKTLHGMMPWPVNKSEEHLINVNTTSK